MSVESVKQYFSQYGIEHKIKEFNVSSATVTLAAQALSCPPGRIAKTLAFLVNDAAVLIVTAGDTKIDNKKYKAYFHTKAKMISPEQTEHYTGHTPGGICPFAVPPQVTVYLDISLQQYETVFPACGSANSAIELSLPELEQFSRFTAWIDVCSAR